MSGFYNEGEDAVDLFSSNYKIRDNLMETIDSINIRFGGDTIKVASEPHLGTWTKKKDKCSPNYTTHIATLLVVD